MIKWADDEYRNLPRWLQGSVLQWRRQLTKKMSPLDQLDNTLQLNLTLFRNNFKNKQESSVQFDDSTQTVATVFANVGSARYQGIELEVQYVASENLNFFGTFGYLDASYTEFETDINPNDDAAVGAT